MYCGNLEWHIWVLGDVDKTQIKHAPLDEESCLPAEIFFSPFCQVLDIWEKGLGWTIQPRDSGLLLVFHHWVSLVSKECYNRHQQAVNKKSDSLPRGAASDASDAWFSWELGKYRRSRRWCILGWRQVSERLMSDPVTEWLNGNAICRGYWCHPYHGDTRHAGSLWRLGQSLRYRCKTTTVQITNRLISSTTFANLADRLLLPLQLCWSCSWNHWWHS